MKIFSQIYSTARKQIVFCSEAFLLYAWMKTFRFPASHRFFKLNLENISYPLSNIHLIKVILKYYNISIVSLMGFFALCLPMS